MSNRDIARVFDDIADILAVQGESARRVRAYQRAAEAISGLEREVSDVWREGALTDIPGIGKILADKIEEMLTTGELEFYDRVKAQVPQGVLDMLLIPDVGPKTAARLWKELGVTTIDELEDAARAQRVQQLSRMGAKTEANILSGIQAYRRQRGRTPLGAAWILAYAMCQPLLAVPGVRQAQPAGSLRRMRETVGDLDLLVAADDSEPVMTCFRGLPQVAEVVLSGPTKTTVRTAEGMQVDLRVVEPERWGTALQYFTGSQSHNIRLRGLARRRGYSLSEYALKAEDGTEVLCAEEDEVYTQLGMQWVPPELREDRGEFDLALERALPRLVQRDDLLGDLQMHTTWSDGHQSVIEMAQVAREGGMRYIAITDHSHSMAVAGGMSEEELLAQQTEIERVNAQMDGFRVLSGAEVEIRADGQLDFPNEVLARLDFCVASLHTGTRAGRERVTERMLAAIRSPHVDMIAHPTNRLLGRREGADLDMEVIMREAARTGTILEINAHPSRLGSGRRARAPGGRTGRQAGHQLGCPRRARFPVPVLWCGHSPTRVGVSGERG